MTLTGVGIAIDNNDADEFINTYLMCIAQGFSMACPIDKDQGELAKKWAKVIAKYRREFSDDFCNDVSKKWFKMLERCNFDEPNIDLQLCKIAEINAISSPKEDLRAPKTTVADIPQPLENRDGLTPAISDRYRERQQAESVSLPELNRLEGLHRKAFQSKDHEEFLVTHLTFSKYERLQPIPKSSVPLNIRSGWEEIIASLFNTIAPDEFLESLTNDWFYLVNQKGIPTNLQQQQEILVTYLAKLKRNEVQTAGSKQSPSIFKKLFGK
ncbi:MAG: hypothetical protein VW397_07135 [Candidatus Margulisiibacteriota bacterium]